ncbi:MAG: hypothetical protein LBJ17_08920 [Dysgonamonadaceae bacterium]|jgi:hypothetical protein|nr:hypothetical protein [Dysgonamonadaceae bacterium]
MNKLKIIFCAAIFGFFVQTLNAQNNTNSPYTRYGYGALADNSFAAQRAMGGIGYGLRNHFMLNPMNPASYSGVDSLTFMFELGVTGQYAWFEEYGKKATKLNGNLEYLALQFRLIKNLGLGIGLEPVSYVSYNYGSIDSTKNEDGVSKLYSNTNRGTGGLNRIYASLGYSILDRISIGVKTSYLYGDKFHQNVTAFSESNHNYNYMVDTLRASGLTFDFGLQYILPMGKMKALTVGAVYSPKTSFNGSYHYSEYRVDNLTSKVKIDSLYSSNNLGFQLPESYGFGFTFQHFNKYTVGADVLYQKWDNAKFYDETDAFNNRLKFNVGGEYIPNLMTNNFWKRVRYRAGAHYSNSYIKVNNEATNNKDVGFKEYGINLGFGFPMVDRRSFLNVALEYSRIVPELKTLISEQYMKITVGYTFNELWFYKQKLK